MHPNFECPKTGKRFQIAEYIIGFKDGKSVYLDGKTRKELVNPENGEVLAPIKRKWQGASNIGTFSARNRDERIKALKKRSSDDNNRQKRKKHFAVTDKKK